MPPACSRAFRELSRISEHLALHVPSPLLGSLRANPPLPSLVFNYSAESVRDVKYLEIFHVLKAKYRWRAHGCSHTDLSLGVTARAE